MERADKIQMRRMYYQTYRSFLIIMAALGIAACNPSPTTQSASSGLQRTVLNLPGGRPLSASPDADEYGEFLAKPKESVSIPINEIAKSTRLNATAAAIGRVVYDKNCAVCHGADLKGNTTTHAPNLTNDDWRFSGDDLESGGANKLPSDVEWAVRYGLRSGNPNARGVEAHMLAFDPQYRNEHDLGDFGKVSPLTANAKMNCFDCHAEDAVGNPSLGSTNLTRKELFLFGPDKASIVESIIKGRRAVMPAFDGILKPEEFKVVSVYVFSSAAK